MKPVAKLNKSSSGLPVLPIAKRLTHVQVEEPSWKEELYRVSKDVTQQEILSSIITGTLIFWSILQKLRLKTC